MNKSTIIFILNPCAGKGKLIDKSLVADFFPDREIIYLESLENRNEIIQQYIEAGVETFFVAGGDGTVNDIAKLLMGTNAHLGIIPTGSGNGLARELGMDLHPAKAIEQLKNAQIRKIDVGLVNDMPFFCTAGIGFDAICAYDFAHKQHSRGLINYIKIVLENYISYQPIELTVNGETAKYFSLTVANARQYGNNAYIAPHALLDDGWLDCCIIHPHPKAEALTISYTLMQNELHKSKYYESFPIKSIKIENISDKRIHIDGESLVLEENSLEIKIIEQALNVLIHEEK